MSDLSYFVENQGIPTRGEGIRRMFIPYGFQDPGEALLFIKAQGRSKKKGWRIYKRRPYGMHVELVSEINWNHGGLPSEYEGLIA